MLLGSHVHIRITETYRLSSSPALTSLLSLQSLQKLHKLYSNLGSPLIKFILILAIELTLMFEMEATGVMAELILCWALQITGFHNIA